MSKPSIWLLAGAAVLTLSAGVAIANEQQAQREASADAAPAADKAERVKRVERDVRVYRHDNPHPGHGHEVRIHRGGGDRDVVIIRGGGREETLTAILQLRADQQPALKTFLEATRNEHRDHGREHMVRFNHDDDKTTMQRLDEMQAKLAAQQAEANQKIAAVRAFYAQLDDKQRKAFDAMPMLMMVGPSMGPMMIPGPMPIVHRMPVPPTPPVPPVPPRPPVGI